MVRARGTAGVKMGRKEREEGGTGDGDTVTCVCAWVGEGREGEPEKVCGHGAWASRASEQAGRKVQPWSFAPLRLCAFAAACSVGL